MNESNKEEIQGYINSGEFTKAQQELNKLHREAAGLMGSEDTKSHGADLLRDVQNMNNQLKIKKEAAERAAAAAGTGPGSRTSPLTSNEESDPEEEAAAGALENAAKDKSPWDFLELGINHAEVPTFLGGIAAFIWIALTMKPNQRFNLISTIKSWIKDRNTASDEAGSTDDLGARLTSGSDGTGITFDPATAEGRVRAYASNLTEEQTSALLNLVEKLIPADPNSSDIVTYDDFVGAALALDVTEGNSTTKLFEQSDIVEINKFIHTLQVNYPGQFGDTPLLGAGGPTQPGSEAGSVTLTASEIAPKPVAGSSTATDAMDIDRESSTTPTPVTEPSQLNSPKPASSNTVDINVPTHPKPVPDTDIPLNQVNDPKKADPLLEASAKGTIKFAPISTRESMDEEDTSPGPGQGRTSTS